ncbi:MAG: isochorismatase family protein [Deltaproteobacteria bacterium]|nr:isochorismatase family protein [Deltaproteobacteria bacterium]
MRQPLPDPRRAVLLVIDMQEYFREIAAPILPALARAIARARERSVPVVYTQHGHDDPARDGGMLYEWWGELIVTGTPGWQLMGEIAPAPGEKIVPKRRYSAFHGTDLDEHLRRRGGHELVIAGVMSNLCCETTARDAFVRDYRVFFLGDGTATADPALHRAALANLEYGFATVLDCEQLMAALGRPTVPPTSGPEEARRR